jgi:inner membrane protein
MEKPSGFWSKDSVTLKLIIIGILSLVLLIPGSMIQSLIREREITRNEVISEINSKWGNMQTIAGPIISIPYKTFYQKDNELISTINYAHFLPDVLEIDGNINPEIRYRGIYKVIVYNSKLNFKGDFSKINLDDYKIDNNNILWDQAIMYVGIPDMRGINEDVKLTVNEKSCEVNSGIPVKDIVKCGITSNIKIPADSAVQFEFNLDLNGSESLNFLPIGKTTNVRIKSDWTTPSFTGAFLPDEREITNSGFMARWNILSLNRNYPQKWTNNAYFIDDSSFGLNLLFPVDHYQKVNRSVKYAIMFICFTFIIFFFSEILNKIRIHPVQYLLVGSALVIFYTLLISLSEIIGFGYSYLISSIMIIALIVFYYYNILKNTKSAIIICLIMILLYLFLFTVIQLQDYSLLIGSSGLFVVLAVIMYLSKNIDWYSPVIINKEAINKEPSNTTKNE